MRGSNPRLYVVGTIHTDIDGKERLDHILGRISPGIIALEMHKDRESNKPKRKSFAAYCAETDKAIATTGLRLTDQQKKTLMEGSYRATQSYGYELACSRSYVKKHPSTSLEYIDLSVYENGKAKFEADFEKSCKETLELIADDPEIASIFLKLFDNGTAAFIERSRKDIQAIYENAPSLSLSGVDLRDPKIIEELRSEMSPEMLAIFDQSWNPRRDDAMAGHITKLYRGKNKIVSVVGLAHLDGLQSRLADLKPTVLTLAEDASIL